MAIVREIRYMISCDTCEVAYEWQLFDGMEQVRRTIRDDGWVIKGVGRKTKVFCPEHNDLDNG